MNLKKGDVIIDIGAGIGVFAIYLAKKHPYLKIYAFEPIKQNYDLILQNIEVNEIPEDVITVVNTPITGDAKQVSLMINPHNSTDIVPTRFNKSGYLIKPENQCLNSITLNEIFETYGLTKVKLLKVASEGYEFEILESCATNNLKKIEYLRGDIYENPRENPDNSARDLATYCKKHIKDVNFCILQRT